MTTTAPTVAVDAAPLFAIISKNGICVDLRGLVAETSKLKQTEGGFLEALDNLVDLPSLRRHSPSDFKGDQHFNPRSKKHINTYRRQQGEEELPRVAEEILDLKLDPELATAIMAARRARKFWGDLETLRNHIGSDGRIHVKWTEAQTGRWYTGKPPIQTMSKVCREFLIPEPDHDFYVLDWAQQELRILAHLSQDPGLMEAFESGDPHLAAFERVTGRQSDPDRENAQRELGKLLNYALIYGLDAQGLGSKLRVPDDRAQGLIDSYFKAFPILAAWREQQKQEVAASGEVTTMGGRVIPVPLEDRPDRVRRQARKAVNYQCQGTAAEQLIYTLNEIKQAGYLDSIRATIHDAFLMETPQGDLKPVRVVESLMSANVFDFPSPVEVKGPAASWRQAMQWVEQPNV